MDLHRANAVGAVQEVAPGGHGAVDVSLAQADAAEVGEDDGAGVAAVEAVDVEGEVEVFLGGVDGAEAGEDHAGFVGPSAGGVVGGPGFAGCGGRLPDGGLGQGEVLGCHPAVVVLGCGEGGLLIDDCTRIVEVAAAHYRTCHAFTPGMIERS
ncbi:hypothetical protein [Streptomyces sp. CB01249]|uniref:hypothetical protein n=1 Tax=Streptomyces sp. CB01249 TaxID=1703929 RepID=UPI001F523E45|nr:hypothetical protein [Streptomyces sp. CB01249]